MHTLSKEERHAFLDEVHAERCRHNDAIRDLCKKYEQQECSIDIGDIIYANEVRIRVDKIDIGRSMWTGLPTLEYVGVEVNKSGNVFKKSLRKRIQHSDVTRKATTKSS